MSQTPCQTIKLYKTAGNTCGSVCAFFVHECIPLIGCIVTKNSRNLQIFDMFFVIYLHN
jgi:hypothetical protein